MLTEANQAALDNNGIALCSPKSSLQTGLLAKLIADELKLDCTVYKALKDIPSAPRVLLIDCQGQDIAALRDIAHAYHEQHSEGTAALLNAEYASEHESILDWPCMSGIFYVDSDQQQLIRGLQCLLDGDYWVPRRLLHHFLDKNRRAPSKVAHPDVKLTRRERQILKLIKDGATNADISTALKVSEHTVKSHLYNVYKKIGVRNRLEASNWVRDLSEADLI
ncbi:LuxR C-terminal-related transcriptional regulator [Saccharophagus degradans]|uniref:Regulatory protein, LuxR n=2 Tax=Saccharophagus degradans TaxID=86304 RepID=Q21M23_SACD2|nr:LuxR C-terminal-related transcriptional regulator [Saccharophagus degradans]ABD80256.1 regulatory protein, LuxR [Saccharophagus degradans 2-40]MBU2987479.1 helix-turn-helix transcriptional regulator [Saccharophagus degradans]MDO6424044.1 LuxR C-terminal-related transcriptional regulator [Saccharophagus degradans]MDO6609413.1 LuxR C-terminal-related transcriptional regulator [Saccharophagus degradans]WGO97570.1 LuxR C-terminal-related transcriptional regulator [Saccharophagus degradans]